MTIYLTALLTFLIQCTIMFYFYFTKQKNSKQNLKNAFVANHSLDKFVYFILIPCLNEGKVIQNTLQKLLELNGQKEIIVLDDNSTDDTLDKVKQLDGPINTVERKLPNAQTGKGDSLNAAMPVIAQIIKTKKLDPTLCIVGVLDADGVLSRNSIHKLTATFSDPSIDSAQLRIKMRDPHTILQTFQDIEFFVVNHLIQMIRSKLNAVALCGNGQFFRYSTIVDKLGEKPWGNALLEDYELTLRMEFTGIKTQYIPDAYVDQEALTSVRRLIKQRARWAQGGFNCLKYLRSIINSKVMSNLQKFDAYFFFFQPILNVLADFSIIYLTVQFVVRHAYDPEHILISFAIMIVLGLFFGIIFTLIYVRELRLHINANLLIKSPDHLSRQRLTVRRAILAIFLISYIYIILFFSMIISIYHLIVGHHIWDKTKRN